MGLALIAGQGALPAAVVAALPSRPLVSALSGQRPDGLTPDIVFQIETLGSFLEDLSRRGIRQVCLCGKVDRPTIDLARIDAATLPLVPRMHEALQLGDDGALRVVIALLEDAGFEVLGAHEAAPGLVMDAGVPTVAQPSDDTPLDVAAALNALADMGAADLGQACIARDGSVVLREDDSGTDALLVRAARQQPQPEDEAQDPFNWTMDMASDLLGAAADWLTGTDAQRRGILFKAPKPDQDRRADLPTIGPDTVRGAAKAGLAGIVIEAKGVIVLNQRHVVDMLDRAGMFLWVRAAD